jgi:type VI protein secretion system component Hcp
MADSSIFLTVMDLDDPQANLDRIPCKSFNFDPSTGGRTYPNIIVHRDLDGMSTTLFRAANMGAHFYGAEIEIDKTGPDGSPQPWSRLTMTDGSFVSDRVAGAPGGSASEVLVLRYKKLKFDDVHNANGQTTPPDGKPWGLDFTTNPDN